jgi:peptidoglycan/LPS O-acetylase OafA/YrhL
MPTVSPESLPLDPNASGYSSDSRIPTLDGWRGIAILMVVVTHTGFALGRSPYFFESLGKHGVTIFFVLSGYLITNRLILEQDRHGSIS